MEDYYRKTIEKILNIDLDDTALVQIDDLNETPIQIIENAQKLNDEIMALYYFERLVTQENWRHLRGFVRSVIVNKENKENWRKGTILVLTCTNEDLLTKEREVLFNRPNTEFKYILPLDYEDWNQNSDFGGTFAFNEPNKNYKFVAPERYCMLSSSDNKLVEIKEHQIDIQFRRWVASRIAGYLKFYDKLTPDADVSILYSIVKREKWTHDALKALDGLLLELKAGVPENSIPGFTGADDYYR